MSTPPLASQGERIESGVIEEADDLYVSVGSEKLLFPWDRGCRLLEQRGQLNLRTEVQKVRSFDPLTAVVVFSSSPSPPLRLCEVKLTPCLLLLFEPQMDFFCPTSLFTLFLEGVTSTLHSVHVARG